MADYSDFLENELLDHWIGGSAYSAPATVYMALFTSATSDDGSGTEVTGGSYARKSITNNLTEWPAASAGTKANANAILFIEPTSGWGLVTHFALFDAATSGNMLAHNALTASKTINSGDTVQFDAGTVDVSLA